MTNQLLRAAAAALAVIGGAACKTRDTPAPTKTPVAPLPDAAAPAPNAGDAGDAGDAASARSGGTAEAQKLPGEDAIDPQWQPAFAAWLSAQRNASEYTAVIRGKESDLGYHVELRRKGSAGGACVDSPAALLIAGSPEKPEPTLLDIGTLPCDAGSSPATTATAATAMLHYFVELERGNAAAVSALISDQGMVWEFISEDTFKRTVKRRDLDSDAKLKKLGLPSCQYWANEAAKCGATPKPDQVQCQCGWAGTYATFTWQKFADGYRLVYLLDTSS